MDNSLEYNTFAEMERLAVDELKKRGLYYAPGDVSRLARELGFEFIRQVLKTRR